MAEQSTVTVAEYTTKSGTTGGRNWSNHILVDGNKTRYSTLDGSIGRLISENKGKQVDIEWQTNERGYKDLLAIRPHVDEAEAQAAQKDGTIVREVALKAAVQFHTAQGGPVSDVLATADQFVSWIQGSPDSDPRDTPDDEWDPQG